MAGLLYRRGLSGSPLPCGPLPGETRGRSILCRGALARSGHLPCSGSPGRCSPRARSGPCRLMAGSRCCRSSSLRCSPWLGRHIGLRDSACLRGRTGFRWRIGPGGHTGLRRSASLDGAAGRRRSARPPGRSGSSSTRLAGRAHGAAGGLLPFAPLAAILHPHLHQLIALGHLAEGQAAAPVGLTGLAGGTDGRLQENAHATVEGEVFFHEAVGRVGRAAAGHTELARHLPAAGEQFAGTADHRAVGHGNRREIRRASHIAARGGCVGTESTGQGSGEQGQSGEGRSHVGSGIRAQQAQFPDDPGGH